MGLPHARRQGRGALRQSLDGQERQASALPVTISSHAIAEEGLLDCFSDVMNAAFEFRRHSGSEGGSVWFRGHANSKWGLRSSIHRYVMDIETAAGHELQGPVRSTALRDEAQTAFIQFKTQASQFLSDLERSDWGLVFAMQHFGLPSRLLDWTMSFACALHFACVDWDQQSDAAIYAVNPRAFNIASMGIDGEIHFDCYLRETNSQIERYHPGVVQPDGTIPSAAVQPVYTNARMVAQQSRFILCGDSFAALDEQFPVAIRKYVLAPSMARDIEIFLALVGMDAANYYPDREGLAKQFNRHRIEILRLAAEERRKKWTPT